MSVMTGRHVLRVSEMSRLAAVSVAQAGAGRVHSVFRHCCNITRPDGAWLAVAFTPFPRTPDAIIMETCADGMDAADFYFFPDLEPGMAAEIAPERIAIPGAGIEIALDGAAVFDTRRHPFPRAGREPARATRNLDTARALIRRDGRSCDAPEFRRRAEPALAALAAAIIADDDAAMRAQCEALLGLGIGLTPSGDDILGGIAAGLFLGGGTGKRNGFLSMLRNLLRDDRRTTDVSARSLKLCTDGEINDGVFEAARAILFDDETVTKRAVSSLLAIGHTSGTETARGLCLGLRLAEEIFCRRHVGGGN
jgi:hypothetical protein